MQHWSTFFGRFGGDCRGAFPTAKGELFGRPKCGVSAKRFGKKAVLARAESVEQNNIVTLDEPLSRWFGEASPKQEANVKKVSEF